MNTTETAEIITISLGMVNVYLIKSGESVILVDAGHKQHGEKILAAIKSHGIQASDIDLIIITHGHVDHIGSLPLIKERTGAKVLIHSSDRHSIEEGRNANIPVKNTFLKILFSIISSEKISGYSRVSADIIIDEEYSLSKYGIDATILPVPGHSEGSICIRVGDDIIVGDAVFPKRMLKIFKAITPKHYFEKVLNGIKQILSYSPRKVYPGHGDAMDIDSVKDLIAGT